MDECFTRIEAAPFAFQKAFKGNKIHMSIQKKELDPQIK